MHVVNEEASLQLFILHAISCLIEGAAAQKCCLSMKQDNITKLVIRRLS